MSKFESASGLGPEKEPGLQEIGPEIEREKEEQRRREEAVISSIPDIDAFLDDQEELDKRRDTED